MTHTVFTVTDEMKIYTKSDCEEQTNEMLLYSGKKSGYAFCQKAEEPSFKRYEDIFSFHLNQAQRAVLWGNGKFLSGKEYGGEYEKLMINRINQYCITPIVPIYFNDMEYMLPELTASTWCNELTHYEGGESEEEM